MSAIERIIATLSSDGHEMYGGEAVTQLQHALQCAVFAEQAGAPEALVIAALLHDYGHLVAGDEGAAEKGIDLCHEKLGAEFLANWFPPAVTEPIRLHVAAKRYLCAVDPDYFETLSPASVTSLKVQGGPYNEDGVERFRRNPFWQDAVKLRAWDDLGKDPEMKTPPLDAYRDMLNRVAGSQGPA
ncbi:MAG: phosphohydrolase [Hyphomicrobiales bacterium]|nr:MAG: phosphohydrolase [Hyphomicrobiales bacterium]